MEENEFSDAVDGGQLAAISELANKQIALGIELAKLESQVTNKAAELRKVREELLPNAMAEAGMKSFVLESGAEIEIKDELYVSVPKEKFSDCETWLRNRGHEGLIKHQVNLMFGKGDDDKATEAVTLLLQAGFHPADLKTIHPQTLKAFIREQLAAGVDIPLPTFGAHQVTMAKITVPKER